MYTCTVCIYSITTILIVLHIFLRLFSVGHNFFSQPGPGEHHWLGEGREVWFGYYQSVQPDMWTVALNVDGNTPLLMDSRYHYCYELLALVLSCSGSNCIL